MSCTKRIQSFSFKFTKLILLILCSSKSCWHGLMAHNVR